MSQKKLLPAMLENRVAERRRLLTNSHGSPHASSGTAVHAHIHGPLPATFATRHSNAPAMP